MKLQLTGLFNRGDRVAVALSGGKDSVVLFNILLSHEAELGIELMAINIEHGIRGEESVRDSEFVKKLVDNARKRLLFYKIDAVAFAKERKIGLEAAARQLRYECFFNAIDSGECDVICTAHHASDNAETFMLNVARGCGVSGLTGIERRAYGGRIVRPMIEITRREIDDYAEENCIAYVTDSTNSDEDYTRNFMRRQVIGAIKEKFPEFERSVLRLNEICREDDGYLSRLAEGLVSADGGGVYVALPDDVTRERPIVMRAVIQAMKQAGLTKDYEQAHVEAVLGLCQSTVGAMVNLPHGYVARLAYGKIVIYKNFEAEEYCLPFKIGELALPVGALRVERVVLPQMEMGQKVAYFAQKQREGVLFARTDAFEGAVIRTRLTGDTFKKFGGGTKPLKEHLIDKKIENRHRGSLPVCARGSEILFIAGVEISASVALEDNAAEALMITYVKE